ncbi:MAG TPA: hypothetical protein DD379_24015 [Cyanobacteria bacterium UBA11162]|nr:hypothetical protein [Cyanobacteria bacterium UBA11162]
MTTRQIVINVPESVLQTENTDADTFANAIDWLPELFNEIWTPNAVVLELGEGQQRGYDVLIPSAYAWLQIVEPQSIPPELTTLDLGMGEVAALTLALERKFPQPKNQNCLTVRLSAIF